MARIRSIKPEFWTSEQVMECSPNARLLFIGLWNFCDDAGRHPFKPKQIKAEVFPGDDMSSALILELLHELSANGLIFRYAVENEDFLQVTGWHHQRIDKPQNPKYPAPIEDTSATVPRTLPPDTIGEDKKGEDKKGVKSFALVAANGDDRAPIGEMVDRYNRIAGELGLPKAVRITEQRKKKLAALYKRHGLEDFDRALEALRRSGFCRGDNGSWRADLDFLLQPQSFVRLLEGRYEDRTIVPKSRASPTLAALDRIISETERGR